MATLFLLGLGNLDSLSMDPHSIPHVKKIICQSFCIITNFVIKFFTRSQKLPLDRMRLLLIVSQRFAAKPKFQYSLGLLKALSFLFV